MLFAYENILEAISLIGYRNKKNENNLYNEAYDDSNFYVCSMADGISFDVSLSSNCSD